MRVNFCNPKLCTLCALNFREIELVIFSENRKNHEENVEDFKSNPECLIYVKLFHCPNFECTAKSPSEKTIQKHFEEIHRSNSNV